MVSDTFTSDGECFVIKLWSYTSSWAKIGVLASTSDWPPTRSFDKDRFQWSLIKWENRRGFGQVVKIFSLDRLILANPLASIVNYITTTYWCVIFITRKMLSALYPLGAALDVCLPKKTPERSSQQSSCDNRSIQVSIAQLPRCF